MADSKKHIYVTNRTQQTVHLTGLFVPALAPSVTYDLLLYETESRINANASFRRYETDHTIGVQRVTDAPTPSSSSSAPSSSSSSSLKAVATLPLVMTTSGMTITGSINPATTLAAGTLSAADKIQLDGLSSALDEKATTEDLAGHIDDTNNPHETTADQVGAYTTSQVDILLGTKADLNDLSASGSSPLTLSYNTSTGAFSGSIAVATSTQNGYLSSGDWTTFNNKTDINDFSASGSTPLTLSYNTSTGAFSGSIAVATSTQNGYLSSGDWTTFDAKLDTADLSGYVPFTGGTANLNLGAYTITATNYTTTIGISIDGGGVPITTGTKGKKVINFTGDIIKWSIDGDVSGTIQFNINKSTLGTYPTLSGSICAAALPATAAGYTASNSSLGTWTVGVVPDDILVFSVAANDTMTTATLLLTVKITG